MGNFSESYLRQLRKVIGNRLVLMPGTPIVIENPNGNILLDLRADFRIWALPAALVSPTRVRRKRSFARLQKRPA